MSIPHVLAIPYPAQGHVIPLMEFALCLVNQGIRVTFVNTEFDHRRVIKSLSGKENVPDLMQLMSIPDGLESWEDRQDLGKLTISIFQVMPVKMEALIEKINQSETGKITCIVADENMGWAFNVAKKLGIRAAAFWPASAALLAQKHSIPKLINEGIIDATGTILNSQIVKLSPEMPAMNPAHFVWACFGDLALQRIIFDSMCRTNETVKMVDWLVCNTSDELEPAALNLIPQVQPIGPLLASNRLGKSVGSFWPEDSDCLEWLDKQPLQSVIYVAFGSFTVFDQIQFRELALGLELTNMPFLWVVRQDFTSETENAYPNGFKDRIQGLGRLAGWVPQQKVLSHPSVACFVSHCGWNSTIEGLSNGVPFLCWPYFADQFLNQSYICDVWRIGLGFDRDHETGIIGRQEIKSKVVQLLTAGEYKERALDLKAKVVKKGRKSSKNFYNLVEWIKDEKKHSCRRD